MSIVKFGVQNFFFFFLFLNIDKKNSLAIRTIVKNYENWFDIQGIYDQEKMKAVFEILWPRDIKCPAKWNFMKPVLENWRKNRTLMYLHQRVQIHTGRPQNSLHDLGWVVMICFTEGPDKILSYTNSYIARIRTVSCHSWLKIRNCQQTRNISQKKRTLICRKRGGGSVRDGPFLRPSWFVYLVSFRSTKYRPTQQNVHVLPFFFSFF